MFMRNTEKFNKLAQAYGEYGRKASNILNDANPDMFGSGNSKQFEQKLADLEQKLSGKAAANYKRYRVLQYLYDLLSGEKKITDNDNFSLEQLDRLISDIPETKKVYHVIRQFQQLGIENEKVINAYLTILDINDEPGLAPKLDAAYEKLSIQSKIYACRSHLNALKKTNHHHYVTNKGTSLNQLIENVLLASEQLAADGPEGSILAEKALTFSTFMLNPSAILTGSSVIREDASGKYSSVEQCYQAFISDQLCASNKPAAYKALGVALVALSLGLVAIGIATLIPPAIGCGILVGLVGAEFLVFGNKEGRKNQRISETKQSLQTLHDNVVDDTGVTTVGCGNF